MEAMNVATELISKLNSVSAEIAELEKAAMGRMPTVGYSVPMVTHCAEVRANHAVDKVAPWGFATFSVIFRGMLNILNLITQRGSKREEPFRLFFNSSQEIDHDIDRVLDLEHVNLMLTNEKISINGKLREIGKIGDRFRISLTPSRRRNALTLMQVKADYLSHTEEERELLGGLGTRKVTDQEDLHERLVELTLGLDMSEIDVLRKGLPDAWQELLAGLGLQDSDVLTFLSFTVKLSDFMFRWHSIDTLFELCGAFAKTYEREEIPRERFERLLAILSSELKDAKNAGTSLPLIRIDNWIRFWPFSYHIMPPELVFVTAVQNKHEYLWSKTFGSNLAKAATYLAAQLPIFENLAIATIKRKSPIGDIDLAIYDKKRRELLICEIKTVFDKFRTDFQVSNFVNQKVNFEKAGRQLNSSRNAIASGTWKLEDIFGHTIRDMPSTIYSMFVLWRDQFNPTLDDPEYIPLTTFKTFVYLFTEAGGDLAEFVHTVEQMERVFWVSRYVDDFWPLGDGQVLVSRELEMDTLPPLSFVEHLPLTDLAAREIASLPHLPEDWREQSATKSAEIDLNFVTGLSP